MTTPSSALVRGTAPAIGQSEYFSEGLGLDINIGGNRWLQAGYTETNTSLYDTTIFPGGFAGSTIPSSRGSCKRYVRIS